MSTEDKIHLRPHHLLCFQFYVGEGYSNGFKENMGKVISRLENEDEFILVKGCDDICKACPNHLFSRCLTQKKVERYDSLVLKNLSVDLGLHSYQELKKKVLEEIVRPQKRESICKDCKWHQLCLDVFKTKYGK